MKKRIDIHGSLEFPLAIGCAAFIRQTVGGMIRTSPVKHFITLPSGVTYTSIIPSFREKITRNTSTKTCWGSPRFRERCFWIRATAAR